MTPQIDHLGKTSTVLRVSTHIYNVSTDIGGKTFIFQLNLGRWPLKWFILEKQSLFWGFWHTFMGFLKNIGGKLFIFRVNLGMWPLKLIILEKQALFWGFQHTFIMSLKDIGGKTFIFQIKLRHVTPQIDHLWKTSPVLRVSTHIYGVSQEIDGKNIHF